MVIWIIGLSAAGKTTLGLEMYKLLKESDKWVFLDGDTVRNIMGEDIGHSSEDRIKNAYRMTRLCKILELQGINVIASVLSISQENRDYNRTYFETYKEIFIEVPMKKLIQRDNKGLYQKALEKKVINVIGVDIPFETPLYSDYVFENTKEGIDFTEKGIEIIRDLGLKLDKEYLYTSKNRLNYPEKYQYTNYEGKYFLEKYEDNRNNTINTIKRSVEIKIKNNNLILEWISSINDGPEENSLIHSTTLLKRVCENVLNGNQAEEIYQLIRKFEISKKIYSYYDKETWLKKGEDFSNLNNYLLFDIALIHEYYLTKSKYKKMICINAILKLNDLIISILNQEFTKVQLKVLLYCLEQEKGIYNNLKEEVI